jgi:hypothetical protein
MGLLDDAIKDHLELKRRHGADPGEVARLEHEALGPARREPAPALAEDEPELADDLDYGDEVTGDERLEGPVHFDEPPANASEPDEDELRVPEFDPRPAPFEEPEDRAAEPDPEPGPDPEPEAVVEQPTRQFSLEELEDASSPPAAPAEADEAPPRRKDEPEPPHADVVPADDEPEGEDVLEETPEFLQETPEHDRLWFEQKPPKDFDF